MEPFPLSMQLEAVNPLKKVPKRALPSPHSKTPSPYSNPVLSSSTAYNSRCSSSVPPSLPDSPKVLRITIATSSTRRIVRPLPAIPSPSSASHSPSTPRSSRPLPTPPCANPPVPIPFTDSLESEDMTSLRSNRATAEPSWLPRDHPPALSNSTPNFRPPEIHIIRPLPPSSQELEPSNPQPPRRHKNMYRITVEEQNSDAAPAVDISEFLPRSAALEHFRTATARTQGAAGNTSDLSSPEDEESGDEVQVHCYSKAEKTVVPLTARFSCHWLREKRGRWEEVDYQSVLGALRSL
ncbi:hypothetical protein C0991_003795 [Blastosporella zonata]|nr:hypothetical protein C0991_003795 [Blastosporella zonata]